MYERTLQSAVRYLATVPRHTLPMTDLWHAVLQESRASKIEECTLPDFAAMLEADTRFDILQNGFDQLEVDAEGLDEHLRDLLILGFSPECLVTLRLDLEGEDGEEMPSLVHRHLSETKPAKVVRRRSTNGTSSSPARQKRGQTAQTRRKQQSARRRRD